MSLLVVLLLLGQRIDTEEVDGSSPFGPTILFKVQPGHMGYTMYRLHG
jgi:hypothetical protein